MNFHSIRQQHCHSIARVLWRIAAATALLAIAPLALAQQVLSPANISFGNIPLTVPVTQTGTFTNNSTFQLVTITAAGTAALAKAAPGHAAEVRAAVFDLLSAEQVDQLHSICTTILDGFDGRDC